MHVLLPSRSGDAACNGECTAESNIELQAIHGENKEWIFVVYGHAKADPCITVQLRRDSCTKQITDVTSKPRHACMTEEMLGLANQKTHTYKQTHAN